ncbi:MAG: type I-E CRISPR-associated protein Cas7/Cse4/CasC [Burkholderiales bacterium]|nr:type I-E CRISPR-associated protein Cas7/Cse4/CasC [Rhodocyclaceae bacterium]MCA3021527.1 type I-E CRISPR-associated protein Cas7/Cse4/CasC [Rhodocyclaceae bacterium]MCA3054074.1 type I-E CRISPR-associated protein Cas7/Cse4/CasC [Rhodocyclaceae bacterium]MCA3058041.1 type I-E CRISPR-associated protein Cas7/Cse4/CasC [Rhodocyclaceae bacterium]
MSRFVQLHVLTSYPPSNLNRDDTGRPKTAVIGDCTRLRVSSQSLKRAWRTSEIFETALKGNIGTRTKEMGIHIYQSLMKQGASEKNAREWAKLIASQFGKLKSEKKTENNEDLEVEQLVHFNPEEEKAISQLVSRIAPSSSAPSEEDLKLLRKQHTAVDIAMFGRMLASSPAFNAEAAIQVAHAITVHKAAVEDDYFTAVDDLNAGETDSGAAHIGELGFGAGVFYLYICIDRELLLKNLGGDAALTKKALHAFLQAVAKVSPTGKQNSFASRAYAGFMLAEKGDQQPRSLAQAFLKPVKPNADRGEDTMTRAIKELTTRREHFNKVYGDCADSFAQFDVEAGEGSLSEIAEFVAS